MLVLPLLLVESTLTATPYNYPNYNESLYGNFRFTERTCQNLILEAFSLGVEKELCRFFEAKNLGVCNAFLRIKLADQLETWHSKNAFST